jgi:hypothetical protein
MVSIPGIVDGAAQMRADGGEALESVSLADQEHTLVLQESDGTVRIILGLSGLKRLARLEKDVWHEESDRTGGGGSYRKRGCEPSKRKLQKASAGNVVEML